MTQPSILLALALPIFSTGCIFIDGTSVSGTDNTPNDSPTIAYADAGCWYDSFEQDYVWWFEADVYDDDGAWDIDEVYADVFDTRNSSWVDSFALSTWNDITFSADWAETWTNLTCGYGDYEVDFVAYDAWDAYDVYTIVPFVQL
jgi:hypothetical protein